MLQVRPTSLFPFLAMGVASAPFHGWSLGFVLLYGCSLTFLALIVAPFFRYAGQHLQRDLYMDTAPLNWASGSLTALMMSDAEILWAPIFSKSSNSTVTMLDSITYIRAVVEYIDVRDGR